MDRLRKAASSTSTQTLSERYDNKLLRLRRGFKILGVSVAGISVLAIGVHAYTISQGRGAIGDYVAGALALTLGPFISAMSYREVHKITKLLRNNNEA